MKRFTAILLSVLMVSQSVFADYTTTKRIVAADITQGQNFQENYIKNSPPKSGVTTGWKCYADAAGSRPVDATGGTPSGVTWTASNSGTILQGPGSFVFTKTGAANKQGMGCSYDISIDRKDRAKVLTIETDYIVRSGTFTPATSATDGDVIVDVYNIGDATLNGVEPSSVKLLSNSTTLSDTLRTTFQTSSTSSTYRIAFHIASTTTNDFTLGFSNISVSRSSYPMGTPVTDWAAYTPTITGAGTPSAVSFLWRRIGDSVSVKGVFTTGTTTGSNATFTLPNGMTVDTVKISSVSGNIVGDSVRFFAGASARKRFKLLVFNGSGNTVSFSSDDYTTATSPASSVAGSTAWANSEVESVDLAGVPITGWSSSVQIADDYNARPIQMEVTGNPSGTVSSSPTNLIYPTVTTDTVGCYSAITGICTIKSAGFYTISTNGTITTTASQGHAVGVQILKNGSTVLSFPYLRVTATLTSAGYGTQATSQTYLVPGDQISTRAYTDGSTNSALGTWYFSIKKDQASPVITASETVAISYSSSAIQNIAPGGTVLTFSLKEFDTHNAFNGTVFTAPRAGLYHVYSSIYYSSAAWTVTSKALLLRKNGTGIYYLGLYIPAVGYTGELFLSGGTDLELKAGETLDVNAGINEGSNRATGVIGGGVKFTVNLIK